MENKIINSIKKLTKNKPIHHSQFKIIQKKSKLPFHIRPNILNPFRKKENRRYTIIIPINKIKDISKMSEKQIKEWLSNDFSEILESQNMPVMQMAGFTIQYLLNKKKEKQ